MAFSCRCCESYICNNYCFELNSNRGTFDIIFSVISQPGVSAADANGEAASSTLSLITDVPPPPLEQYVYNEGYPHTPLRPSTKKTNEGGPSVAIMSTSNTPDEIFSGAMMARKIGVDRSSSGPDLEELREDNGEKLAMERLW